MDDFDNNLNTQKNSPMKNSDWFLLGILILLLLITFPFLWRIYRFIIPLGIIGLIIYLIYRFMQMGKIPSSLPEGTMRNFTSVWTEFKTTVRNSFRTMAITVISLVILSVTGILLFGQYSKKEATEKEMARITQSLAKYKSSLGNYPASIAELVGNDPLKREWYQDSWGNEMNYSVNKDGLGYQLSSPGADGKLGTGDDLVLEK